MEPEEIAKRLAAESYLADEGTATAVALALSLQRPLFLEGEPGVGKSSLATSLASALSLPLVRLQCYEGLDVSQSLYDWNFPRQMLHLRSLESRGDRIQDESDLYDERFLIARPLLQALREPCVLLIDEIDRADDEFEAFLLELLGDFSVTIPEIGTIRAAHKPITILTSNRTRDVHDALKRRCLYHWIDHPTAEREIKIIMTRVPEIPLALAKDLAACVEEIRSDDLIKPPGVAESIAWAEAFLALGERAFSPGTASRTLGALLKYREDMDTVRARLMQSP
jgi:MoxR-like ATPase